MLREILTAIAAQAMIQSDNKKAAKDSEFAKRLEETRSSGKFFFISCIVLFIASFFFHTGSDYYPTTTLGSLILLVNAGALIFASIGMIGKKPGLIGITTIVMIILNVINFSQ